MNFAAGSDEEELFAHVVIQRFDFSPEGWVEPVNDCALLGKLSPSRVRAWPLGVPFMRPVPLGGSLCGV